MPSLMESIVTLDVGAQEPWPNDVKLFQPYAMEQILLPDNANCLAVQAFLHMCGLPFQIEHRTNAEYMSPSGRVPFIKCGAFVVSELEPIVQFIANKGITLTEELSSEQKSDMRAYMSLISTVLLNAELYICWCDKRTYNEVTKIRNGSVYPWPLNYFQTWSKRSAVISKLKVLGWYQKNLENVYQEVEICCQALSERLDAKEYFFGSKPVEVDAYLYGHIFAILSSPEYSSNLISIIMKYPNLIRHCKTICINFVQNRSINFSELFDSPKVIPEVINNKTCTFEIKSNTNTVVNKYLQYLDTDKVVCGQVSLLQVQQEEKENEQEKSEDEEVVKRTSSLTNCALRKRSSDLKYRALSKSDHEYLNKVFLSGYPKKPRTEIKFLNVKSKKFTESPSSASSENIESKDYVDLSSSEDENSESCDKNDKLNSEIIDNLNSEQNDDLNFEENEIENINSNSNDNLISDNFDNFQNDENLYCEFNENLNYEMNKNINSQENENLEKNLNLISESDANLNSQENEILEKSIEINSEKNVIFKDSKILSNNSNVSLKSEKNKITNLPNTDSLHFEGNINLNSANSHSVEYLNETSKSMNLKSTDNLEISDLTSSSLENIARNFQNKNLSGTSTSSLEKRKHQTSEHTLSSSSLASTEDLDQRASLESIPSNETLVKYCKSDQNFNSESFEEIHKCTSITNLSLKPSENSMSFNCKEDKTVNMKISNIFQNLNPMNPEEEQNLSIIEDHSTFLQNLLRKVSDNILSKISEEPESFKSSDQKSVRSKTSEMLNSENEEVSTENKLLSFKNSTQTEDIHQEISLSDLRYAKVASCRE